MLLISFLVAIAAPLLVQAETPGMYTTQVRMTKAYWRTGSRSHDDYRATIHFQPASGPYLYGLPLIKLHCAGQRECKLLSSSGLAHREMETELLGDVALDTFNAWADKRDPETLDRGDDYIICRTYGLHTIEYLHSRRRIPVNTSREWNNKWVTVSVDVGPADRCFHTRFDVKWTPPPVAPTCVRVFDEVGGAGDYEDFCEGGSGNRDFKQGSSVHPGADVFAIVHGPSRNVGVSASIRLPSSVTNQIERVAVHPMIVSYPRLVEQAFPQRVVDTRYVGLNTAQNCEALPDRNFILTAFVSAARRLGEGGEGVFVCFYETQSCTGGRRCWWYVEGGREIDFSAYEGTNRYGLFGSAMMKVSPRGGSVAFANFFDPALVEVITKPIAQLIAASDAWTRDTTALKPTTGVSCRGEQMALADFDLEVDEEGTECPGGCVGLRYTSSGVHYYVYYNEEEDVMEKSSDYRSFFKVHKSADGDYVVLEVLAHALERLGERRFLILDPVAGVRAATTPMEECGVLLAVHVLEKADDSLMNLLVSQYDVALSGGADAVSEFVKSPGFVRWHVLGEEFCGVVGSSSSVAAATQKVLCGVLDLVQLAKNTAHVVRALQSKQGDLTLVQNIDLGKYLIDVVAEKALEELEGSLLLGIRGIGNQLASVYKDLTDGMQTVATSWSDSQTTMAVFTAKLTAADILVEWKRATDAEDAVRGLLDTIQDGVDELVDKAADRERLALFSDVVVGFVSVFAVAVTGPASPAIVAATAAAATIRKAAKGVNAATDLGDDARKAAANLESVAEALGAALGNLAVLNEAMVAIKAATETAGEGAQAVPEASREFIDAYESFDRGNVVDATASFYHLESLVSALCDIMAAAGGSVCAGLAQSLTEARMKAEDVIVSSYAAARQMGMHAAKEIELNSLAAFAAEVDELPSVEESELVELYDRFAVATVAFHTRWLQKGLELYQLTAQFCAVQRYNYGGYMSDECQGVMAGEKLVMTRSQVSIVTNSRLPLDVVRRSVPMVAGLPTSPDGVSTGAGRVDVRALLAGETVPVQIPTDKAWMAKYGWDREDGILFVQSLKIDLPINKQGVQVKLVARFQTAQSMYMSDGTLVRQDNVQTAPATYTMAPCAAGTQGGERSPYAVCTSFLDNCNSYLTPFAREEGDLLPTLHSAFTLKIESALPLEGVDFSDVVDGGMVLRVEAMVVQVGGDAPPNGALRATAEKVRATRAQQPCCDPSHHVVDWFAPVEDGCAACPSGSSSAATGGLYCESK